MGVEKVTHRPLMLDPLSSRRGGPGPAQRPGDLRGHPLLVPGQLDRTRGRGGRVPRVVPAHRWGSLSGGEHTLTLSRSRSLSRSLALSHALSLYLSLSLSLSLAPSLSLALHLLTWSL